MYIITQIDLLVMAEISKDLLRKWSIHELALSLKKHYNSIYYSVQRLLKEKILSKNANGLIEPLFRDTMVLELAEMSRRDLQNKEIKVIVERLNTIKSSFFSAVLFGSSVNNRGGDIDLLLIIPDSDNTEVFRNFTELYLGSFSSKTDLNIVHERSCFEMLNHPNELNVFNQILKNHLVLLGTEHFYRIIKRWKNGGN